jgi:hypothetical protein
MPGLAWPRADPAAIVAFCLVFSLLLFLPAILNDGDTLWQITAGGWILDHRAIPATDPFSFTAGDRRWFAHEWLAETLMALCYRTAGLPGVMALAAAATGLTAAILLHHLRRFLPDRYAVTALIVALSAAAPSMLARPHLLAWPCLAVWSGGLVTARAQGRTPSWTLLPVMLVWVNLHGSFLAGLLLLAPFLIETAIDATANRLARIAAWTCFSAAAWLVALINPDGVAGLLFPFRLLGSTSLGWIGEWQAADFSTFQPIEVIILGGLALGLSGRAKLPPIRLLLFLGLVYAALAHVRHQQLLGIVGALIVAEPLGANLAPRTVGPPSRLPATIAAVIAAAALAARLMLPLPEERTGAPFAAMLEALPSSLRQQPVLNEYSIGAKLIFYGVRPFIDSRADLYGDAMLSRYRRIASADPAELSRVLAEYRIAWTIFPTGHPVIQAMDQQPGWRRLTEANGIIIHARIKPNLQE